jgi:hypothetical protein
MLTNAALYISTSLLKTNQKLKPIYVYSIAVLIAGVYVLLQEFKVHDLGGANVFDLYDVVFSCLGLILVYLYLIFKAPKHSASS